MERESPVPVKNGGWDPLLCILRQCCSKRIERGRNSSVPWMGQAKYKDVYARLKQLSIQPKQVAPNKIHHVLVPIIQQHGPVSADKARGSLLNRAGHGNISKTLKAFYFFDFLPSQNSSPKNTLSQPCDKFSVD